MMFAVAIPVSGRWLLSCSLIFKYISGERIWHIIVYSKVDFSHSAFGIVNSKVYDMWLLVKFLKHKFFGAGSVYVLFPACASPWVGRHSGRGINCLIRLTIGHPLLQPWKVPCCFNTHALLAMTWASALRRGVHQGLSLKKATLGIKFLWIMSWSILSLSRNSFLSLRVPLQATRCYHHRLMWATRVPLQGDPMNHHRPAWQHCH